MTFILLCCTPNSSRPYLTEGGAPTARERGWIYIQTSRLAILTDIKQNQPPNMTTAYREHSAHSIDVKYFICKWWSSKSVSTNSKTHNTLYTSKNSIFANIRYYFTEQKTTKLGRTNTGRMSEYCTREEKYSRNKFHTAIYQEKNIYNWFYSVR